MRTTTVRTGALILTAAMLPISACSASGGAYCDALKAAEADWASAGTSLRNKEAATHFLATVKQVEGTAPDEVRSEWVSLETLVEKFTVDKPDLTALTRQMQGFEGAAKKIETHAKETCGIDLSK